MKNTKKQNIQKLSIIVMSAIILLGIGAIVLMPKKQQETKPAALENQELKRYNAQGLKISMDIKDGAVIDDRPNLLVLYYGNDEIMGNRTANDYDTLEEYLANLSEKNNWGNFQQKSVEINGNPGKYVTRKHLENDKNIYFFQRDGRVYSFSASSPELEQDLKLMLETISFE